MPFRIRIIHKGLTMIALPLLFGIAFVLLLLNALSEFDKRLRHELLVKDAMITVDSITRKIFAARVSAAAYFASKDPTDKESFHQHVTEATNQYKHLRKLLKNEKGLERHLQELRQQIMMGNRFSHLLVSTDIPNLNLKTMFGSGGLRSFMTNRPAYTLMDLLRSSAAADAVSTLESMKRLQYIFLGGILSSVLLTVFLAVYLSLNISSRLLRIVDNTARLSRGAALHEPQKGNDEIAELDQFLCKSAHQIRELEQFKKELVGIVSHELKSPLSSLDGLLSALSSGLFGELNKKAKSSADRALKSVRRLMGLVMELLDLDRLEAGQLEITREEFCLNDLVTAAVDTVKELSEQSGVLIEVRACEGTLLADRNRLVQVIVNLLSNAMKFSPPGGTVTVEAITKNGCLECRVSDQGRGIPESFRKEIFEPFKQVDTKDANTKKGTGLGLTISRSIVEQHHGLIGADSVEGEGSTFWFRIPLSADSVKQSTPPAELSVLTLSEKKASTPARRSSRTGRIGRFGILHKGLMLISVPLLFQLCFASVTGFLFYQIGEQVRKEEHSKEIVDSLNRVAEKAGLAINSAMMYLASEDPEERSTFNREKQAALLLFEHVIKLSTGDAEQQKNIDEMRNWVNKSIQLVEQMLETKETDIQSLLEQSGFVEKSKPLQQNQIAEEKLLNRERLNGEKLARQRARMIADARTALLAAIVLNIILSTTLLLYFMRSITGRLRHVMENTARLVKRETLEPPLDGSDEIAYLDRSFYEAGKHLVELETFKQELISIVSHELRTPLMSIYATLQVLNAGALGELSDKAKNRLRIGETETSRLIRLINNLLDIEKIGAGQFVLDISEVSVDQLLKDSAAAVFELAEAANTKLEVSSADEKIMADRDRLSQVLINLLSNAIKFSDPGSVVKLEAVSIGSQICISVIDQGRGIPAKMKDRIFERFVQVYNTDASEKLGSGLGLALSKCMVEQHGGTLGVESEAGLGSTFWIKLPQKKAAIGNLPDSFSSIRH